jgi:hypothetical protein
VETGSSSFFVASLTSLCRGFANLWIKFSLQSMVVYPGNFIAFDKILNIIFEKTFLPGFILQS